MSNDPDIPTTQPTIETVLERINALGERLSAEIQAFREEVDEKFYKLGNKLDVLNDEFLEIKAEQKWHGKRLDELERKVS